MSLTTCIKKAGDALRSEDKAAIITAARENRSAGLAVDAAGIKAIDDQIAAVRALLAGLGVNVDTQRGEGAGTIAEPPGPDESPQVSEAQARKQFEWRDRGQTNGTKTHMLFWFEKPEGKGTGQAMNRGDVQKFPGSGWKVNGEGNSFESLADAKAAAIEAAIPVLREQGWIESAPEPAKPEAKGDQSIDGDLRGYAYALVKNGQIITSGSFPSKQNMDADVTANISHFKQEADAKGADLYIGGYPNANTWTAPEGLIFGLTFAEIDAKQQRRHTIPKPISGKMPKDAVIAYEGTTTTPEVKGKDDLGKIDAPMPPVAGNVAMFSRASEREALDSLAENEDAFLYKRGKGTTLQDVAKSINPKVRIEPLGEAGGVERFTLVMPDGNRHTIKVRQSVEGQKNPKAHYGYGTEGADPETAFSHLPGNNWENAQAKPEVYLDVSLSEPGTGGGLAYVIAMDYAHNTGSRFIGDPAALSDEALIRRPEHMLSSALKWGTTEHLAPHPRQLAGLGVPALDWTYGDDVGNIKSLIDVVLQAGENRGTDAIKFDLKNGNFTDRDGKTLSRGEIDALADASYGRKALAGGSTLARHAFLRSILREVGKAERGTDGRPDGLLEKIRGFVSTYATAIRPIFYSRSTDNVTQGGQPVSQVQALVDQIAARWENAPQIVVVQSLADERVPDEVRKEAQELQSAGEAGKAEGFYDKETGAVFLIADNLPGDADTVRVLMHESLGHFGLRGLYGDGLGAILDRMATLNAAKVRNAATRLKFDFNTLAGRRMAAEEVLAYMAQEMPELGWVKNAVAAVRSWLRKHIPGFGKMQLSNAELIRDYILPAAKFVTDGVGGPGLGVNVDTPTPFSRAASTTSEAFRKSFGDSTQGSAVAAARGKNDPRLTQAEFDAALIFVKEVEALAEKHGSVYVRWSASEAHDLSEGAKSRDAGSGEVHSGLSSQKIDADMHPVTIARRIAEYGFSRGFSDKNAYPRIYTADETGTDSDNAVSITNLKKVADVPASFVAALDKRFHDAYDYQDSLNTWSRRKNSEMVEKYTKDLNSVLQNAPPALNSDSAMSRTGQDQTDTAAFKAWFGKSKVVDANGAPLVVYHGTTADFAEFDLDKTSLGMLGEGFYFARKPEAASGYAKLQAIGKDIAAQNVMPVYLSLQNPFVMEQLPASMPSRDRLMANGYDGIIFQNQIVAFDPTQIKSATGNNGNFDPADPRIAFSRNLGAALTSGLNNVRDVRLPAGYMVGDLFNNRAGKLNWWHKSVGTMYNTAQKHPEFGRVYDAVQNFLGDVSYYAAEAANLAPNILPKLETWKDITKSPLSAQDTKAISAPIFEGTLTWGRDAKGVARSLDDITEELGGTALDDKAHMLIRDRHMDPKILRMWQGLPQDKYESMITGKFEKHYAKSGVVFTPAELKKNFGLNDAQVALYREFRSATDKSIDNLAVSEMLRLAGKDADFIRQEVLDVGNLTGASEMLRDQLIQAASEDAGRNDTLMAAAEKVIEIADHAQDMKDRGYAPLSRFGTYTLEAKTESGERYFSLFESTAERAKMARTLTAAGATDVTNGTMSQEDYKLLQGISPETIALFGDMIGLDSQGSEAKDLAFQEYVKRGVANRSALKRLIHRKGIAGFSEDAGRVLAGFVYSNGRRTASNLNQGDISQAVSDIPKEKGELKDAAMKLSEYVSNPQEEAQWFRGLLFAQYLGGSIASAMVNATQPFAMTFPYLSQFGGVRKSASRMIEAGRDALKPLTGDAKLDAALKKAEERGIVSPQEVHQLQAQAAGSSTLRSGDGTIAGDAAAKASNSLAKLTLAWGKVFGVAEQFNRRVTFIAAYRTAVQEGIADPQAFAEKAVVETQGVYNKANRPRWARGVVGSIAFTFKQYGIAYVELLTRMGTAGKPGSAERAAGQKAALLMLAILFLLGGSDGLPFMEDAQDLVDAGLQRMGYNFSTKQRMREFLIAQLGKDGAEFVQNGVSGLPGAPIDASGRFSMGNMVPGSAFFQKKTDYTRDLMEFAGPGGDLIKRTLEGLDMATSGDVGAGATNVLPVAARNALKGMDMAETGMYRDTRGRKVIETTPFEAAAKAIGFQPRTVDQVQRASWEAQRQKSGYILASSAIREKWARAIFEGDVDKKQEARDDLATWNENNPDQPIRANMPAIVKRVKEMRKTKAQRMGDTAPKAIREQVRRQLAEDLS